MHVLLLAADAPLAEELAGAWRAEGAGAVTAAVLPARSAAAAPAGVFVPLESLGLRATAGSSDPEEARLRALADEADLVVVLAGRAEVSRREWSAAGVSGVHEVGAADGARSDAVGRAARTWAPRWEQGSRAR